MRAEKIWEGRKEGRRGGKRWREWEEDKTPEERGDTWSNENKRNREVMEGRRVSKRG